MNRQPGRIGLYLVLIVMLVAGYFYLNNQVASQSNYTMDKLEQAAQDGRVTSATLYQNREVPTGSVAAEIEGEGQKKVNVTDVNTAQEILEKYDIHPDVRDVPQESVFLTSLLPVIITGVFIVFMFIMMNRQMSGGGGNSKMMNFGKSRARMMLPEMEKNGTPASPATALARRVLPVPGGPTRITPFGILAPTLVYFCGALRKSTTSTRSSFSS